jgi:dipeptidyl aminopeptidase/acylaminoacyl peptidase
MPKHLSSVAAALALVLATPSFADPAREAPKHFTAADVFNLEYANDPQISPDGKLVAYVRVSADIMIDRFRRSIWLVDEAGKTHRPVAQGAGSYSSPVWSPDGKAIAYTATENKVSEVRVFNLDTQRSTSLGRLPGGANNLSWSPDGKTLAFQMFVEEPGVKPSGLPDKPDGAEWNKPARITNQIDYRQDGEGLVKTGYAQIFVLPADGGTARQLTWAARNHDGRLSWTPDGKQLLFAANREDGWEYNARESDIYSLTIADGSLKRITDRKGPDGQPAMSPDGKLIAYTGFDNTKDSYVVRDLYVANADGSASRNLTKELDRDITEPQWAGNGVIYFSYEDQGLTKLGKVAAAGGKVTTIISDMGGTLADRPYTGGAFSVNNAGRYAAVTGTSQRPGDVTIDVKGKTKVLTSLNEDLLAAKTIPAAEHIVVPSSFDKRPIDAWIVRPPNFDPKQSYPLLLEIHGGPHSAYGPTFAAEAQLYAAAGYVLVYSNPRGSTSYGGEFGRLISHDYPSHDYDDLMSVVDATIAKGSIDTKRLYVTGGSGGGVLTAWIVGTTDRFKAAMVQKPVINWTSHVLSADNPNLFGPYWLGKLPWEPGAQETYWAHSPLSRVGNVKTPTAVLVGEDDNRTPHTEAEQYYQALQLLHVPTELVLIPASGHEIATRPTGLIAKVYETLAWFAKYGGPPVPDANTGNVAPKDNAAAASAK